MLLVDGPLTGTVVEVAGPAESYLHRPADRAPDGDIIVYLPLVLNLLGRRVLLGVSGPTNRTRVDDAVWELVDLAMDIAVEPPFKCDHGSGATRCPMGCHGTPPGGFAVTPAPEGDFHGPLRELPPPWGGEAGA